ncbi:RICIN domain-containing protein [Streptomyces sp. NPDC047461]|uniref:RICIN domain-containing protein n=1 Tax=Streptomyces sp. NPDC047461 TaxID=3155619 RepID=UPI0033F2C3AA
MTAASDAKPRGCGPAGLLSRKDSAFVAGIVALKLSSLDYAAWDATENSVQTNITAAGYAPYVVPAPYYKLVNRNSGRVLGIDAGSTADGAQVAQWIDTGALDQQWSLVAAPWAALPEMAVGKTYRQRSRAASEKGMWSNLLNLKIAPLFLILLPQFVGGGGPRPTTTAGPAVVLLAPAVPVGLRVAVEQPMVNRSGRRSVAGGPTRRRHR